MDAADGDAEVPAVHLRYVVGDALHVYACGPYDGGESWVEPEDLEVSPPRRPTCPGCLEAMHVDAEVPW